MPSKQPNSRIETQPDTDRNICPEPDDDIDSRSSVVDCHLIVFSHGLWGTQDHFLYMEKTLRETLRQNFPDKVFVTYKTKSNEKFKTYDGIDLCGYRVADEIMEETANLLAKRRLKVCEFSMVGYSLGGLIARFAIGILAHKKYFEAVEPINFVTFCSPHVGVLTPGNTLSINCFNNMVPYLLGNSGKQMFLKDSQTLGKRAAAPATKLPLLRLMAAPNSIFFQSLKSFKYRSVYSNIRSDIRTSWWTSGISYINPFEILDKNADVLIDYNGFINFSNGAKFQLDFIDDYSPVLLDCNKPIKFTGLIDYTSERKNAVSGKKYTSNDSNGNDNYLKNLLLRKFKWVILIFNTFIYLPMWMTWFILFNLLQVFTSSYRVSRESSRLHDKNYINSLVDKVVSNAIPISIVSNPSTPLLRPTLTKNLSNEFNKLENDLHDQGDYFLDSVFDAVTSSKNPNQSIFNQDNYGDKTLITSLNKICSIPIDDIDNWEKDYQLLGKTKKEAFQYYQILKSFKMNMSKVQREIIDDLNTLRWSKYPVYITKTKATHAAAIVRHDDPLFEEGKMVIDHFCNHTFKVE